ncbi:bacillithiol biosynthesis deacetylase BshB1 [candidate division KSB1 bacterium]|nr:bacillithiol biosynthesis deacetylase BshB1 [candidate division KSB1 bacterium]
MKLDVLAFGAHADDVELGCSGTIAKLQALGYKTGVVTLTQGEMGTRGNAEIRRQEFETAGEILKLSIHNMLDLPDGFVEVNKANKLKLIHEIREYQPSIVFAPYWVVRHPDHGAASRLVREACFLAGLKKIDTGQDAHRPYKVMYYHSRFEFKPSFIVDITDYHKIKIKSILAYKSQFHNPDMAQYGPDQTLISRPDFLDRIITRDKQYGTYIGVKYGEPFLVREAIKIDDPVAHFGPEYLETIP